MTAYTSAETPKIYMTNLLIFKAGGVDCAFPLEAVQEVVPMATLFSPPGLPSGLAGFLNLRGTAVPIIRLDRLFELPARQPGLHTPMIVLRGDASGSNNFPTGVLVESVHAIVPMPSGRLLDIPEGGTFRGCATAALEVDGKPIHLLSAAALLEANEGRLLADYRDMAQARLLHTEPGMEHSETEERV
jgi:purine-binding chemotaxis protein CheW